MSNYNKSIDFLLEHAGAVIQYRLRKEILQDITKTEEENLLEKIYQTPQFQLVESYVKPNGYIGSGCHSWANWKGRVLQRTPLEDSETAARLLSYYQIPKEHPIIQNYIHALGDEELLKAEFSYIPPEVVRFENRFKGLNSGNSLGAIFFTIQAMLGHGDDFKEVLNFQEISLKGFERVLGISSLEEITRLHKNVNKKYNYPYIEAEDFFPDSYTMAMLAYTRNWRSKEHIHQVANALNHINRIMKTDNELSIKIDGKYYGACFPLVKPIRPFLADRVEKILYRRTLTEIAMLGVGRKVDVIEESVVNIEAALDEDGILRTDFDLPKYRNYLSKNLAYPTAYVDVKLEPDYGRKYARECDLTFWALEFLTLVDQAEV